MVDGVDVRERIRGAEVTRAVSPVSAVPAVRRLLVARQRELIAAADAVVVEGRDIGTVVLPDATLKVYLTASPEVRAQRRAAQLGVTDPDKVAALAQDLRRRDEHDSKRADSPLRPAEDAVVVDSTRLDRAGVVERILELARAAVPAGGRA
jgi:cytidylate kinase